MDNTPVYEEDPHYDLNSLGPWNRHVGQALGVNPPRKGGIERFFQSLFGAHVVQDPTDDVSDVDNLQAWTTAPEQDNQDDFYVDEFDGTAKGVGPVAVYEKSAPSFGSHHEVVSTTAVRLVTRHVDRRSITLIFPATNTANVAIGPDMTVRAAGTGNPNGQAEFPPGSTFSFACSADIWMIAGSGTQDVQIIELQRDGQ